MHMTARLAAALVAAGGSVVLAQQAPRPQATFRSQIDYVEVDVLVTDADGNFVPGLTVADFELFDAGKSQSVESVREINVPIERADRPMIAGPAVYADVATNEGTAEGRIFVFVLDDFHTTAARTNVVRKLARDFITTRMGSNDLAAVVQTSGSRKGAQDFTSDRSLLLAAVDRFMGIGLQGAVMTRLTDYQNRSATQQENRTGVDTDARERLTRARVTFDTIRGLATDLEGITGRRKALLLFSEGVDVEGGTMQLGTRLDDTRRALQDAIAAATRANVHVYAIDSFGLTTGMTGADVAAIPFNEQAEAQGLTTQAIAEERRQSTATLRSIAAETGGAAIVESSDFAGGFAGIQRDNSSYYMLGFYPSDARDGKFHKLDVRVKRPGLQVRARAGYHAPKSGSTRSSGGAAPMSDLMTAALPTGGLPMRVAAPAFKGSDDKANVLIALDLPRDVLRFEPAGEAFVEDLHVVFQAIGTNGKPAASDGHELGMRLTAEARGIVEASGLRFVAPLRLKPGRYQLRLAAEASNAGRRGSVFADVVVPDFQDERLVWSGIALTSEDASAVPTRAADAETSTLIPLMPSAIRTFAPADTLSLYAEVYENGTRDPQGADLTVTIRDEAGRTVFSTTEARTAADAAGSRRRAFGLRIDVPLKDFKAGSYVLSLGARSRAAGNATATRETQFAIAPAGNR
jgi:VWFA-related protein